MLKYLKHKMIVLPDKQTCLMLTNKNVKVVNQHVKDTTYNANLMAKAPTTRDKYNDYTPEQKV